jgi:hypothetical protein
MRGFIYFLTNASFPGLVKIGHTTQDIESRIKQLNSTGVPSPFELGACFSVADSASTELAVHRKLASQRNTADREFFIGLLSELVSESASEIFIAMNLGSKSKELSKSSRLYDLEDQEVDLLMYLSGIDRRYGYSEYYVVRSCNEPHLKTEVRLANLTLLKLATEKVSRNEYQGSNWKITSAGKKFLFDYGHLTADMLQD